MSTAQIRTSYFKLLSLSGIFHLVLLCPFLLTSHSSTNTTHSIAVTLRQTSSNNFSRETTLKQASSTKSRREPRSTRSQTLHNIADSTSANAQRNLGTDIDVSPNPTLARNAKPKEIYKPQFTLRALSKGIEGEVVLEVKLNEQGQVRQAHIRKSLGYGLDEVALDAIFKSTFEPAYDDAGAPTSGELIYHFKFEINDSNS